MDCRIMEMDLLNLRNYREHPENSAFVVFYFREAERAVYFESLLEKEEIQFEKDSSDSNQSVFLYGIRKTDFKRVQRLNNIAIGKFRERFIPHRLYRSLILGVAFLVLVLAVLGYFLSGK